MTKEIIKKRIKQLKVNLKERRERMDSVKERRRHQSHIKVLTRLIEAKYILKLVEAEKCKKKTKNKGNQK